MRLLASIASRSARLHGKRSRSVPRAGNIEGSVTRLASWAALDRRVWQMAFTPDGKSLLTTNGLSNDVSIIDVASLSVVKSIPVGRLPWGVIVAPK